MIRCPEQITVKPRLQVVSTQESVPRSYVNNFSFWLDMECQFPFYNERERSEIDQHEMWSILEFQKDVGLEGYVSKIMDREQGNISNQTRFGWLSTDTVKFELKPEQNEIKDFSSFDENWIEDFKPTLDTIKLNKYNQYKDYEFGSKRIERRKTMLNKIAEFSCSFKYILPNKFIEFVDWYRYQMLSGNNKVTADWLVHRELGAWKGNWAEPWSATFNGTYWEINIKLLLVEDSNNEAFDIWKIQDAIEFSSPIFSNVCANNKGFGCLLNRYNNRIELIINRICEKTTHLECE